LAHGEPPLLWLCFLKVRRRDKKKSRNLFLMIPPHRDTLFATWAVGESAHVLKPQPAKFSVEINDQLWKQFDLTKLQG
jgi:hypothetical protein